MKREKLDFNIGENIKRLRKNHLHQYTDQDGNGYEEVEVITQQALADMLGVTIDTIRNWEQGYSNPRFEQIPKLLDIFNCSVNALLGTDYMTLSAQKWISDYSETHSSAQLFSEIIETGIIAEIMRCASRKYTSLSTLIKIDNDVFSEDSTFISSKDLKYIDRKNLHEMLDSFLDAHSNGEF